MKVSQAMAGVTPSESYEGICNADDMLLALNLGASATSEKDYIVVQEGITEATGALEAETSDKQYLRSGKATTKTGTSRTFTINGDRICGDEFQDAVLAHAIKFGTGSSVVKEYVYFNMLTGKGEKGKVSISVEDDLSGGAGENASFAITLSGRGTPTEYTYSAE